LVLSFGGGLGYGLVFWIIRGLAYIFLFAKFQTMTDDKTRCPNL